MSAQYTKIPLEEPNDQREPAFQYNSVFTYEKPEYFSYGKPSSSKYRSAFTYQGISNQDTKETVVAPAPKPPLVCVIWASVITVVFYTVVFITLPISFWFCFKKLPQYERYIVFRLGRMLATKGPGYVIILPFIDRFEKVDLRTKAFSIPPLTVVTSDKCTIEVGADLLYHTKDAQVAVNNVQDLNHALRNKSRACLQEWLGKYNLKDIQSPPNKRTLQIELVRYINEFALPWGIEVTKLDMSAIKVLSESDMAKPQNPLEVLQTMFSGGSMGAIPGAPGDGANPMQQMASQLFARVQQSSGGASAGMQQNMLQSMMGGLQAPAPGMQSIQPHLAPPTAPQQNTAVIVDIDEPTEFSCAEDLLNAVQGHLSEALVREFGAIYKFVVTGPNGGSFYLDLKNGSGKAEKGEPTESPDVTLTLSADDLGQLLRGQMSTFNAYMSGCLQVEGDTSLASKLSDLIEIVKQNRAK